MMVRQVWRRAKVIFAGAILASCVALLLPLVSCTEPSSSEIWVVGSGDVYPVSIINNVETAGNGTKSIRQTGTLQVVTTLGSGGDFSRCAGCSGTCLVLNRSALVPEWDAVWFAVYDGYNASDATSFEITCLCPSSNAIPDKVLTKANWQDISNLLQVKNTTLFAEATASGATDYVGTITGSETTVELSYSYSNGTSSTGVKRNGKITYTNGILAKMVFNEELKDDPSGFPPNTVIIRSTKWTMGQQGVFIPGIPVGALSFASLLALIIVIRKKSRHGTSFQI